MMNNIILLKQIKKNPSKLKAYRTMKYYAKKGLAYKIRLYSFSDIKENDKLNKAEIIKEVFLLLQKI